MANLSSENNYSSNDNHSSEKYTNDKRTSHKYEHHKNKSETSNHSRRRSPSRSYRDSPNQENRDYSGHYEERNVHLTKEHRIVSTRSEDKDRDQYKSRHNDSNYDRHNNRRSSTERSDSYKSNDERFNHNRRYNDNRSSDRSHDRSADEDNNRSNHERSPNRERFGDHRSSERGYSHQDRYASQRSFRDNTFNSDTSFDHLNRPNDERHISYKNNKVPHDEEFIASLFQKIDFLSNQVDHLTQENERLKQSFDHSAAEVTIAFSNKRFEEKFAPILKELATDLVSGRCSLEALTSFLADSNANLQHSESWNPEDELFSLDISCEEPKESSSVPRYDTNFCEILQVSVQNPEEEALENKDSKRLPKQCFNCDGDHFIGECPLPLNPRRIANARRQTRSKMVPNKRYHVQTGQESDYKPGIISEELREALNLQKNQIPLYIYRMRIIDYPPGWLQEAAVEHSGITLYDSEGNAQSDEKNKQDNENGVRYDSKKLVDYPGFNTPLPPDIMEESAALGLPPIQHFQMRDFIEQTLPKPEPPPSRKRKLELPEAEKSTGKSARLEESMEVDDDLDPTILEFNPPLPEETLPPPPPDDDSPDFSPTDCLEVEEIEGEEEEIIPIQLDSDSLSGVSTPVLNPSLCKFTSIIEPFKLKEDLSPHSGLDSPSLLELEEMKKRLVIELSIANESSNSLALDDLSVKDTDDKSLKPTLDSLPNHLESNNDLSSFSDDSFSSKASASAEVHRTLQRTESVGSKLVSLGTPSISRHSSYSKLPDYDNFSKDVTEHLNFENLPNSTGTYAKMKKVIKKVKDKINLMMQ